MRQKTTPSTSNLSDRWGSCLYFLFQLFKLYLCIMGDRLPGYLRNGGYPGCRVADHAEQRECESVEDLFREGDLLDTLVFCDEQQETYGDYAEVLEDHDLQYVKHQFPPSGVSRSGENSKYSGDKLQRYHDHAVRGVCQVHVKADQLVAQLFVLDYTSHQITEAMGECIEVTFCPSGTLTPHDLEVCGLLVVEFRHMLIADTDTFDCGNCGKFSVFGEGGVVPAVLQQIRRNKVACTLETCGEVEQ